MLITINNKKPKTLKFSGGECHVNISSIEINSTTKIVTILKNSDAVMTLLLAINAIRNAYKETKIYLEIPYLPYARQDRICNKGEAFSIKVMADIINSLHCEEVTIYDPHSKITCELINKCKVVTQAEIIAKSDLKRVIHKNKLKLVSPDAGAKNKTSEISKVLNVDAIYCSKIREVKSGFITQTHIPTNVENQDYILVDDICDGGRTFIELAKKLKNGGANSLYLYVTHGIFSQGLEVLKPYFKHIYCYHTFLKKEEIDIKFLTLLKG